MKYINRRGSGYTETVGQFDTLQEAREMLKEYRFSDSAGFYWISSRPCKEWTK